MPNIIFFAWQLDTPSDQNKGFIWRALTEAASSANSNAHPEMSPRPESDTQGIPGSPNIVEAIFNRIRACSVFVADLTFVGTTPSGKQTPNPNVLIELGFAARSVGWDRTILVLNNAFGDAKDLPFDILQHRWPIEYRLTEHTQVRDKRYATLAETLAHALQDCAQHELTRAATMADALDTSCLDFIALHEAYDLIEMPLPAKNMGQVLMGLEFNLAARRLMELGALRVVSEPHLGYGWTYDGRVMIRHINTVQPHLLRLLREHKAAP